MKYRILYKHGKYIPQYQYQFFPFWFTWSSDCSGHGSSKVMYDTEDEALSLIEHHEKVNTDYQMKKKIKSRVIDVQLSKIISSPDVYPFEKELAGKNEHSVYSLCPECGQMGINFPLDTTCGYCGCKNTVTYYDAKTIHLNMSLKSNKER